MIFPAYSPALPAALNMALDDEYRARATYQAIVDAYGPVTPFANIVQAEQRHIEALLPLFQRYGLAPPYDRWNGNVQVPPSLQAACEAGVQAEINNYQMYDRLLTEVAEPDVRAVFSNLRNASAYHHLPAFQACAAALAGELNTSNNLSSIALGLVAGAALIWLLTRASQSVGREA